MKLHRGNRAFEMEKHAIQRPGVGKKVNYPGKPEGEREMPVDAGAAGGG